MFAHFDYPLILEPLKKGGRISIVRIFVASTFCIWPAIGDMELAKNTIVSMFLKEDYYV